MENERNNRPVPAQWLHMLNSTHIQQKIDAGPKMKALFSSGRKQNEIIEDLYLTILSRFPTPEEVEIAKAYSSTPLKPGAKVPTQKRREDWVDLAWALVNSTEFLYRH